MNCARVILSVCLLLTGFAMQAQPAERKFTPAEYIETYKADAVREMLVSGVPASITLAQGMLESGNGNSALAVYANNHFGIKCHAGWTGETYIQDDDEKNECFRKYASVYDSYLDHSEFLRSRSRYASLFELKISDYKGWARGLKEAGYATDPRYADRLIELIERYKLNQYDKAEGAAAKPVQHDSKQVPASVAAKPSKREVFENNGVEYIIVKKGDSFLKLAEELGLAFPELIRYNDLRRNETLRPGQMLYIERKKKAGSVPSHVLKPGETLQQVSQQYGIRLKSVYKINKLKKGATPKAGTVIYLQKHKS